jgi:uncharacterized protein YgbK (DUF1537 family)
VHVLALADDLTGALETAAKFAEQSGMGVRVEFGQLTTHTGGNACATVIDTESRHLASDEAADSVRAIALSAAPLDPSLIYKKTDSTLRGNIAAETLALAEVFPGRSIVYVPAYPKLGRTVREGCLYIGGVPAHLTRFAQDPLNPVYDHRVRALFPAGTAIEICDGESEADIEHAARDILRNPAGVIACGPAALAGHLATLLATRAPDPPVWPTVPACLIVNGSLHPQSRRQVEAVRQANRDGWTFYERDKTCIANEPLAIAAETGAAVARAVRGGGLNGLIVFGGDTAVAIVRALGSPPLVTLGEILTGVPVSRLEVPGGPLWLITKAGGFGHDSLLLTLYRALSGVS